jgi:hypothetical protein
MFYNPAGLNSIKGYGRFELLNPLVALSTNTVEFAQDIQDVADAQTDAQQATLAADLLQKWLGEHLHARTSVFPNLTFHNFGIGVLAGRFRRRVHAPTGSNTLQIRGRYDVAGWSPPRVFRLAHPCNSARRPSTSARVVDQSYTANDLFSGTESIWTAISKRGRFGGRGVILSFRFCSIPPWVAVQNIGDIDWATPGR